MDVFRYRDYRAFLGAYYAARKVVGYSYRRFAKDAGLSAPNYLKLVIDGERNLSPAMAPRFAKACRLTGAAAEYFELVVAFNQATSDNERNALHEKLTAFARFRTTQRLDLAQKEYHSHWYVPALRELVACPGFQENPAWISATMRPPITEKQAARALDVLFQLGLVERDEKGRVCQASRAVSTGDQAPGLYIRNYHKEMLQRAADSMYGVPAAEREISSVTVSASEATLAEARRRLLAARAEIVALCDADPDPDRVAQINFQLFPLTQPVATPLLPAARPRRSKS